MFTLLLLLTLKCAISALIGLEMCLLLLHPKMLKSLIINIYIIIILL